MSETMTHPAAPPGGPPIATDAVEPQSEAPLWASAVSLGALIGMYLLAFSPAANPSLADKVTLPVLAIMAAAFAYAPFLRRVSEQRDVASFALCAAFFVVHGLSRRVTGESGPAITLFGDPFPISYAAMLVIAGAVVSAPAWLKGRNGWTNAMLGGLAVLAVLAFISFRLLANHYEVGTTATLDPGSLAYLGTQIVEYGALALCCSAVANNSKTRRIALIILPALLLLLAARYRMMPAPAEEEEE